MLRAGRQAWHLLLETWQYLLVNPRPNIPEMQDIAVASTARMLLHEPALWQQANQSVFSSMFAPGVILLAHHAGVNLQGRGVPLIVMLIKSYTAPAEGPSAQAATATHSLFVHLAKLPEAAGRFLEAGAALVSLMSECSMTWPCHSIVEIIQAKY